MGIVVFLTVLGFGIVLNAGHNHPQMDFRHTDNSVQGVPPPRYCESFDALYGNKQCAPWRSKRPEN